MNKIACCATWIHRQAQRVDRILQDFLFPQREAFLAAFPHGLHGCDRMVRSALGPNHFKQVRPIK